MSASIEPFKGMGDVQILAEMRRLKREKAAAAAETRRTRESLEQTVTRLQQTFTGNNAAVSQSEVTRRAKAAELAAAQKRAAALWNDANVPDRQAERKLLDTTSENGRRWKAAFEKIRVMGKDALVALVGINGNGKTQIAVELMREATSRGESALWVTATRMLMDVKACYRDEAKTTEREVVERYTRVELLVIDEIHRRRGSDWENALIFEIIDTMYNARKPVIVIANQTPAEFEASMDGSIISRMNETGGIIHCDWESFREGKE
jgi:DNA replication protein DnaC